MKKGEKYPELQRARVAICPVCESEFRAINDTYKRKQKFCSKDCWSKRRVLNKCEHCHSPITSYYGKKYCSRVCSHAAMVGSNSSKWIDGKSLERDRIRLGTELKEWRKSVFIRDNYTCQHCGDKKEIQAHHIEEWAKCEEKRFELSNGVTLCIVCHGKVHNRDFTKRNKKFCMDCGKKVKAENTRCRPCTTKNYWAMRKLDPTLVIKKNGVIYE